MQDRTNEPVARLVEHIARIICIDPLYPTDIGPHNPDDWRRDPITDAKVRLWELYIPHAEKAIELAADEIERLHAATERRSHLLWEAANRLDMASALVNDERVARRLAETRDRIREEIKHGC